MAMSDGQRQLAEERAVSDRLRAELSTLREQHSNVLREHEGQRQDNAAKDARIAGLEAQLRHMHTFDGQHRARIAELEAYHTNCTDYINGLLGNMADDDKERVAILARADRAKAELKAMRELLDWIYGFLAYLDSYHSRMIRDRVRAALAPSPAGREG